MGNWCEVIGGYNDTKCTSWNPTQNNYTNKPIDDCAWGDSPVSHLHMSDLPVTWQITENFRIKIEDVSESATRQFFKVTVYYDNNELVIDSNTALGASSESSFGIGFGYQDSDTSSSRYGFVCVFKHIVNEAPNTINIVSRPASQNESRTLYPYIKAAIIPPDLNKSGGAGSGYIGNSLLSNKKMVGYNVPTSSEESTKTESVEDAKSKATSGKPKIGNGYARITLLREIIPNPPDEWKTEVDALKDFEIDGKKFINSNIPAGFDGDGFTNKGDYTYVCVASSTNWQNSFNFSHIATIKITTNSGGGYDVAYENLDHVYMKFQTHISMYGFGMCQLRTGSIDPYYFWPYNTITWQQSYEMATSQTHFDNLTNLFKYLNVHYRNVNLFVDGECWALA